VTVATPRVFIEKCDTAGENMLRRLADLKVLYGGELGDPDDNGAYGMSLEQAVRGSAGKITHGMSDPTVAVVGDPLDPKRPGAQAALRKVLERAPKRLVEAENILSSIEKDIRHAMDRLDPAETFEPLRYPITTTEAERRESKEAQDRRKSRGVA
jgi:hypothetical protein